MQQTTTPKKSPKKPKNPYRFMKYTGMAFQMAITISLFTFGGVKLDAHYQNEQPIFTA